MKFDRKMLTLYAVTDRRWSLDGKLDVPLEKALRGGVTMVQLREKSLGRQQLVEEAIRLKKLCHRFGAPLLIDNDVEACMLADADGVHLGQNDMPVDRARKILGPDKIIGATAHNVREAVEAERLGADYLGSGAAFGSRTKTDITPITGEEYLRITETVHIPVCAIGGIDITNIDRLRGLGLSGAAVVSGIFAAADIESSCIALLKKSREL